MTNIQEGFKRLTAVLSVILGIIIIFVYYDPEGSIAFAWALMAAASVWILYFMIKYIVRGFRSDATKRDRIKKGV